MDEYKIAVVVVTYNRLEKLKKAMRAYSKQVYKPKYVIVVDNNSQDGTKDYLEEWKSNSEGFERNVINLEKNLGGSGGFYMGEKYALKLDCDWVMVADDDAYPEPDYLAGMVDYISRNRNDVFSVVCGAVMQQGEYAHRTIVSNKKSLDYLKSVPKEYYSRDVFDFDAAGYLGLLINKRIMQEVGCINPDFFIWADDVEHCLRLKEKGRIVCLPKLRLIHDTENVSGKLSWKYYYGYRNRIIIAKRYFGMYYFAVLIEFIIKSFLCLLKRWSIKEVRLRLAAILDGHKEKLGIHKVYKPGWKE